MSSIIVSEAAQSFQEEFSELATENQPSMTGYSRVAEFHAFVAQNAEVLGESERSPGFKAPIGLLVKMCPVEITEENVDTFYAEVRGMVARAHQEIETPDETEEIKDEAEPDETETAEQTQDESAQRPNMYSEKEEPQTEQATNTNDGPLPKAPSQTSQTQSAGGNSDAGVPRTELTAATTVKGSNISAIAPAKTSELSKPPSFDTAPPPLAKTPQERPVSKTESRESVETNDEETEKPTMNIASDTSGITEPNAPSAEIFEPKPSEQLVDREVKSTPVLSETNGIEGSDKEQPITGFIDTKLDTSENDAAPDLIELKESATKILTSGRVEDESVSLAQNEAGRFSETVISAEWEEDSEVNVFSEGLIADEFLQVDTEHATSHHLKLEAPEPLFELSLPVEEVEHNVQELAERIEALDAEESRAVHDILDKIVVKFEEITASPNNIEDEEYAQAARDDKAEEMKELFIDLFDRVELDYTPELLESLTGLAMRGHMAEFTKAIEADTKNRTAVDRGTHEAINRLLAVVSRIKKAVLHAYSIGRSMLRLYSQQMTAAA